MKHVSRGIAALGALGALVGPAAAQDDRRTDLSRPSEADIAAARAVADPVILLIEGGDTGGALASIKDGNPLWSEKTSEVNLLAAQAGSATELYGAVAQCVTASYRYDSSLRIDLSYVCQHERGLMSWRLTVDRLPRGWTISNVRFSDNF